MACIELATFRVTEESVDALIAGRSRMIQALQAWNPAIQQAHLTRADDGSFVDVIIWSTRADALEAASRADEIPEVGEWFSLINDSGGIRHVDVLDSFVPAEVAG